MLSICRMLGVGSAAMAIGAASTLLAVAPASAQILTQARAASATPCHNEGSHYWTTSAHSKKRMTHVDGWHVGPGLSTSKTKSVEKVLTLTAGVTTKSGAGAKVTAGKVLGEIQAHYDIELAASGSVSKKTSESVTWNLKASNKDRYYALYSGHIQWTGSWTYHVCHVDFWRSAKGQWRSFEWTKFEGGALCTVGKSKRRSAYTKGSPPYIACQRTWWGS